MSTFLKRPRSKSIQPDFGQFPWAGNHKVAIAYITRYMDVDSASIIQHLDERILGKIAKDHL